MNRVMTTETQENDAIRASRHLAAIVESSDDAIVSKDLNGIIQSWNPGAERLFGYTAEEAIGRPITIVIPIERHPEETRILSAIRRGERVEHYETVRQRKDGTFFNASLTVSPIFAPGGQIIGASKIARNITERVRGERRRLAQYNVASLLAGSRSLEDVSVAILKTIASVGDWVSSALWLVDDEPGNLRCIAVWNSEPGAKLDSWANTSREMQFRAGEGLPGRVWATNSLAWVSDVDADANFPRIDAARAAGPRGGFAFPTFVADRTNGVIEIFSREPIEPDPDFLQLATAFGSQIGLFIERLQIERELALAKDAAETANAAKDRFLAMLSHELRTPLTPVLLSAEAMMSDPDLSPFFRDGLKVICRNVELEARLIDDLLDLTRISRGKLRLDLDRCDVHDVFRHALETVHSEMQDRQLQVDVKFEASSHECTIDGPRLQQVFWNLLRNACKFSPVKGRIEVRSSNPTPSVVRLEVADEGVGIQPENLRRIFDAFEQVEQHREGLGLGLAISKVIAEMHGGSISAQSAGVGKGATFVVDLPLTEH